MGAAAGDNVVYKSLGCGPGDNVVRRWPLRQSSGARRSLRSRVVCSPRLRPTSARRSAGSRRSRRSQRVAGVVPRDGRLRRAWPASAPPQQQPPSSGAPVQLLATADRRVDAPRPDTGRFAGRAGPGTTQLEDSHYILEQCRQNASTAHSNISHRITDRLALAVELFDVLSLNVVIFVLLTDEL